MKSNRGNVMQNHHCDVAIVGAGTAGLAAERSARAQGAKTLLIDELFAGTLCATFGCMPSKLLIAAAAAAHAARRAPVFGVGVGGVAVDGRAVMRRLQAERDKFVTATKASISNIPEGICLKAKARFTGPGKLVLDDGCSVEAHAIVIATGASPFVPEPFEGLGDLALTNRTIFEMDTLPRSLAVIGGGAIGLEIAQAMARLGVQTVLFDQGDTLGGAKDDAIQRALVEVMGEEMTLHLGVDVTAMREGDKARIMWSGNSAGALMFDKVLVATGRPPNLEGLDLGKASLELDDHGVPHFDPSTLQCGDAPIFIAGDGNGDKPFLHEASNEGAIAGRNAASYPDATKAVRNPMFSITFTDPPLAMVGAAPDKASLVGCADYTDQGRAKVEARAKGLGKLYATRPDGRLTGAELFAPGADHMAHLLVWAIKRGETASSLLKLPFYHPTLEEGLKPALREICDSCGVPVPTDHDSGNPAGA